MSCVIFSFSEMDDNEDLTCEVGPPCCLVLADGTVYPGRSFGAQVPVEGEVGSYKTCD